RALSTTTPADAQVIEIAGHASAAAPARTLYPVGPTAGPATKMPRTADDLSLGRTGPFYKAAFDRQGARRPPTPPEAPASRLTSAPLERPPLPHQRLGQVAPQRHHQLARQGHDQDALEPLAPARAQPGVEPSAERALRLMLQP